MTGPGLFLIECDTDRLRAERNDRFGDGLQDVLRGFTTQGLRFVRHGVRSLDDLRTLNLAAFGPSFDGVALVAHSNWQGARAAPDAALSWEAIAQVLAPLRPKAVLLVACFGGMTAPTDALFAGVPTLQVVYGSPLPINREQVAAGVVGWLADALGAVVDPTAFTFLHALNVIGTGGLIFRRTRQEYETMGSGDRFAVDVFGVLGKFTVDALKASSTPRPRAKRLPVSKPAPKKRQPSARAAARAKKNTKKRTAR